MIERETYYVYGHSDDLIEIRGDEKDELYAEYGEPTRFEVAGVTLDAEYDGVWKGVWTFNIGAVPDECSVAIMEPEHSTFNDYSEVVVINRYE